MNIIWSCCNISRVWRCYTRLDLLTYVGTTFLAYSVHSGVTQICYGEPADCLWKNTIRMCNTRAYIWYPNDCLARIVYIWLNIDILRIETVSDYYDFLVHMYNAHCD